MTACRNQKDRLLDYALGVSAVKELEHHLKGCPGCSAALNEWRGRREQLDAALLQLVRGAEPAPGFHARVLAALEAPAAPVAGLPAWAGALAAVAVIVLAAVLLPSLGERWSGLTPPSQTSVAALSEWRSPTESLLRSPADELLGATPRLGEFYFPLESLPLGRGEENGGNDES